MDEVRWIKRGTQKTALAQALTKPMTVMQLTKAMLKNVPKANKDDVRHLLAHFEQRGLVKCLTPKETKGRVYAMTETGRILVKAAFNIDIPKAHSKVRWKDLSGAARSELRSMILLELNRFKKVGWPGETKAGIKKAILVTHGHHKGASASSVRRAVEDLIRMELVMCIGVTESGTRKLYDLTAKGIKVAEELALLILVGLLRFPSLLLPIFFKGYSHDFAWQNLQNTKPTLRKLWLISRQRYPQN